MVVVLVVVAVVRCRGCCGSCCSSVGCRRRLLPLDLLFCVFKCLCVCFVLRL